MPTLRELLKFDPVESASSILDGAVRAYAPSRVYALFSGGHDSLVATHLAAQHPRFSGVIHVNTGIGIKQTRDFVRSTCEQFGWELTELQPPGKSYRELVLKFGFPGPGFHSIMYRHLKERAVAALVARSKIKHRDRIGLVTGVRLQESIRRMGYVQPIYRKGAQLWIAPVIDWMSRDKNAYVQAHGLPRNPVVELMCMSGECLCGAFAREGELDELLYFFPEDAEYILDLMREVRESGRRTRTTWGHGEGRPWRARDAAGLSMCSSCTARQATDERVAHLDRLRASRAVPANTEFGNIRGTQIIRSRKGK